MRTLLLSLLLVPVLLLDISVKADTHAASPSSGRTAIVVKTIAATPLAPAGVCSVSQFGAASQGSCSACGDKCSAQTQACKDGSIKSCYLAAACVCRCNLDAGGCGSSTQALKECVEENEKLAREVGR